MSVPEWASPGHRGCMIGNNSLSLIADAYVKGIRGFDTKKALEAMVHQTTAQGEPLSVGRNGYKEYLELGYVPYPDYYEATAKTLEYAYADWCLSTFASALGEADVASDYKTMAYNYEQAAIVMRKLGNHAKAAKLQLKANQYYQKAQLSQGQLEQAS